MNSRRFARRKFLLLAGSAGAASACSSPDTSPVQVGDVAAGNAARLLVGSLETVGAYPVCIGRDAAGAYAMTLTCTHAGCDMGETGSVSPQGLRCGCHGSEFDINGDVVRGPATRPLVHFALTVDASGNLIIHSDQIVSPSQRLTV